MRYEVYIYGQFADIASKLQMQAWMDVVNPQRPAVVKSEPRCAEINTLQTGLLVRLLLDNLQVKYKSHTL